MRMKKALLVVVPAYAVSGYLLTRLWTQQNPLAAAQEGGGHVGGRADSKGGEGRRSGHGGGDSQSDTGFLVRSGRVGGRSDSPASVAAGWEMADNGTGSHGAMLADGSGSRVRGRLGGGVGTSIREDGGTAGNGRSQAEGGYRVGNG